MPLLPGGFFAPLGQLVKMLADFVQRKGATAGSLDDWELGGIEGSCLFLGMISLARILGQGGGFWWLA